MVALATPVNCEAAFKQQFAAFMAQGFTPFMSALKIWPNNNGYCAGIANAWQNDPDVVAHIAASKTENKKLPPTKEELAVELHTRAQSMEDDDYVKASRLVSEMLGYMPKATDPSIAITNNVQNNRVMVVKDKGTDDAWEAKLQRQQQKLIEHNG